MTQRQERISIESAAHRTGLAPDAIRHCVQIGMVSDSFDDEDLTELRRVRRLLELEVNLAGVEIIVRMRRRIIELQTELAQLSG
jgi:DNA-binding transcriptional MerR regulator